MTPNELHAALEEVDGDLAKESVLLLRREFEAYRRLVKRFGIPGLIFEPFGSDLFHQIHDWYLQRYGQNMNPEIKLGEKPILIRGVLYFLRFPVAYGTVQIDVFQQIQGVTPQLLASLSKAEQDEIGNAFAKGYEDIVALEGMDLSLAKITKEIQEIISRGLEDITASITILKGSNDTQGVIFHAHGAAEKFLKAAVAILTNDTLANAKKKFGKVGHDLQSGLQALAAIDVSFSTLSADIGKLHLPNMDIRYAVQNYDVPTAVAAIGASCTVCSSTARMVL
jgi:hypothetical protein